VKIACSEPSKSLKTKEISKQNFGWARGSHGRRVFSRFYRVAASRRKLRTMGSDMLGPLEGGAENSPILSEVLSLGG
jgi:hypothetical protein